MIEGVTASVDGAAPFAVSPAGVSVHLRPSPGASARRLILVEGSEIDAAGGVGAPVCHAATCRPTAGTCWSESPTNAEHIWAYDLRTSTLTQITFDAANRSPIWTADGLRATFASNRNGAMNLFVAPGRWAQVGRNA